MELDRARIVDENFRQRLFAKDFPLAKSNTLPQEVGLNRQDFLALFNSQLLSRHIDLLARVLREQGHGFYTISSSGHEGNAAIAKAFKVNDIAFLHYRSGAFIFQRAKYLPKINIIYDQILSLVASKEDPISGGRHKVFGSVPLWVPPQTSTIASHLPKALGCALSITQTKVLQAHGNKLTPKLSNDSVVLCSFGDASANHSTAQGAFNAACWIHHAQIPLPLVWICEDNGWGISVPTPANWIAQNYQQRPGLHYIACDGGNLADVYRAAFKANTLARKGQPVFLHMKTVRLLGHAGSDIEFHYRSEQSIRGSEADDPLLHTARIIYLQQWLTSDEILQAYEAARIQVAKEAEKAVQSPKLGSAKEICASIIPPRNSNPPPPLPTVEQKQKQSKPSSHVLKGYTMAQCLNLTLADILLQYPTTCLFGEDVGKKGGVYRITADLQARFGIARVFDTLLDEQTILGTAIGFAHNGLLPIPEIQFLAYTHNAVDQIRGEAATLSFFSQGQYTNPMVIRIPSLGYQKGFGGHFHNDNAIGFLREIPGIIIACPSTPKDAALLLRESVMLAYQSQRVVIFLEPIALYMLKDKYSAGDGLALMPYPSFNESLDFGELGFEGDPMSDVAIISYGNGMVLSRQAAYHLKNSHQISTLLIDLRWLAPLNITAIANAIKDKSYIIIVDECRKTGSLSEELVAGLVENISPLPVIERINAKDCFIPLGTAWEFILPSCQEIMSTVLARVETSSPKAKKSKFSQK